MTPEEKERLLETKRKEDVRKRAASAKDTILRNHRWLYEEIVHDSTEDVKENPAEHWKLLLRCFQIDDVVWIGDKFDSGKPEHGTKFRSVSEWLKEGVAPGPFICPVVFKTGSYSRSNDNVIARRFLVVESDVLGRDEVGAVFRWLERAVGMKLRAVIDTAGKSLHAWFDSPPDHILEDLMIILPELDCDPKLFTASQPVRLPGALRDGKFQKLIYLSKEVVR